MQLEQLIQIRSDERAKSAYVEHGKFALSWATHDHFSICLRKEMQPTFDTGRVLALLWTHQLHSLEEWNHIQIATNRNGCICFLCRMQEKVESTQDQLIRTIKTIEYSLSMADL
ncbi:hypothetical protein [Limnohabitans sp. 2KL-17]|uniref:hypothetical protein n=1 Tax=Limnohabitans sp. 2KL-17 TaxID=1100704 RepID=UPI001E4A5CB3|nr:hypothetical protein [Limnohabitans sp. 2KL-17]